MIKPSQPEAPVTAMRTMHAFTLTGLAALVGAVIGCTPARGYHPEADVPENQARVHKPDYRGGEIEPGELEPEDAQAKVERGEPPPGGDAAWADPSGDEEDFTVTAIVITAGLAEACEIERVEAYFSYDSAQLDPASKKVLAEVAECLHEGPLAGHGVTVVGHADPRGSDEYNRELGESRAASVARILAEHGVATSSISVETRGEALAHSEPEKWPLDRRVELHLGS